MKQFLVGLAGAILAGVILLHIEYNVMDQDHKDNTETGLSAQEQYEYSYDEPGYSYDEPEYTYDEPEYTYDEPEYTYDEPGYSYDENLENWEDDYQSSDLDGPEYMTITDYSIGTNGFYYEFNVTEDSFSFVELDGLVIWGSFEFSRALTYDEDENLYHSGRLEDQYGNEIEDVSYWAHSENSRYGVFAAEFPKDLPHGNYTYELILDIRGGNSYSSTVSFDY